MTRINLSDLPPKVREQIEQQLGRQQPKKSRRGVSDRVACAGHCGTCGLPFASAYLWEQHVKAVHAGHGIWSIDLPEYDSSDTSPQPGPSRRPVA